MGLDFANLTPKQSAAIALGGLVLISGGVFGVKILKENHAAKVQATKIADNKKDASFCIGQKSQTDVCDRVEKSLLEGDLLASFEKASALRQEILDKAEKERKATLAKMEAEEKARKAYVSAQNAAAAKEKAATEAKFKAEGWWEPQPGIFLTWCKNVYCPGPTSNGYSDYTWRAMVWCKERACGNIYARLNITQNGTVVGWTNDTAYGGYGQKVVLTFGSSTRGNGSIVEFKAY